MLRDRLASYLAVVAVAVLLVALVVLAGCTAGVPDDGPDDDPYYGALVAPAWAHQPPRQAGALLSVAGVVSARNE